MRSALYSGVVRHWRRVPRPRAFAYRLHLAYLDLDELPEVFAGRWLWSTERRNVVEFRRSDYLGDPEQPLREAVLDRVESELGHRPGGRIGIATQLRTFGYLFNPVSFYFCHDAEGELAAIVAEITNTPWGERHAYVKAPTGGGEGAEVFRFSKEFHVSPFLDLDQTLEWSFSEPGDRLEVHMANYEAGELVFRADLECERRPITATSLASALLRHPVQPLRLHAAIYWQAALLFLKRTPFFAHPDKRTPARDATIS